MNRIYYFLLVFVLCCFTNTITAQSNFPKNDLPKVGNIKVERLITDSSANINWWSPGTSTWFYYDNGESHNRIRYINPDNGEQVPFEAAIVYTPEDLVLYDNMKVTKVSFFARDSMASYDIRIWTGVYGEVIEYEQKVVDFVYNEWNTYDLKEHHVIDINDNLLVGLWCNSEGGYPGSLDNSEKEYDGKGDLMRINGVGMFRSLSKVGIDGNWNIRFEIAPVDESTSKPDAFNIYRNDEKIATTTEASYLDKYDTCGYYDYYITSVFDNSESDNSDTVTVLFDANRFEKNAVILEEFTSMTCSKCVGSAKTMPMLMSEGIKLAPISYHPNSVDKYYTEDALRRENHYSIDNYPTVIFDGTDGMNRESYNDDLYKWYKPKYTKFLDRLTPFSFDTELTWEDNNSLSLKVSSEKLGIYDNDNFYIHVAIVENSIMQSWQGYDSLHYVLRKMYPSYEGTEVNFKSSNTVNTECDIDLNDEWQLEELSLIAFLQDKANNEIVNGEIIKLTNDVVFVVSDNNGIIENASVSINETIVETNTLGIAKFGFIKQEGELNYSVEKEGYVTQTGSFNLESTDTVLVDMNIVGVSSTKTDLISVYPNPTNGSVTISGTQITEVLVYDITGQLVVHNYYNGTNTISTNLDNLEAGTYIIKVNSKNNSHYKTIVKK